jgi:hypothetical protein
VKEYIDSEQLADKEILHQYLNENGIVGIRNRYAALTAICAISGRSRALFRQTLIPRALTKAGVLPKMSGLDLFGMLPAKAVYRMRRPEPEKGMRRSHQQSIKLLRTITAQTEYPPPPHECWL